MRFEKLYVIIRFMDNRFLYWTESDDSGFFSPDKLDSYIFDNHTDAIILAKKLIGSFEDYRITDLSVASMVQNGR